MCDSQFTCHGIIGDANTAFMKDDLNSLSLSYYREQ